MPNVEQSSYPNWNATAQKRFLKLSGDELMIYSPATPSGNTAVTV